MLSKASHLKSRFQCLANYMIAKNFSNNRKPLNLDYHTIDLIIYTYIKIDLIIFAYALVSEPPCLCHPDDLLRDGPYLKVFQYWKSFYQSDNLLNIETVMSDVFDSINALLPCLQLSCLSNL